MTIEQRLETLENELERVKRRNRMLIGCLVVGLVVVAAVWILRPHALLAQDATSQPGELKVIRANEFVLEDEKGEERAVLKTEDGEPRLVLYNENGLPRVGMVVSKGKAIVGVCDETGRRRAQLVALKNTPELRLFDKNGQTRVALSASESNSGLTIRGETGANRAELCVRKGGPDVKSCVGRTKRAGRKGGPMLRLFDESHKQRISLLVEEYEPSILLFDENGKVKWQTP